MTINRPLFFKAKKVSVRLLIGLALLWSLPSGSFGQTVRWSVLRQGKLDSTTMWDYLCISACDDHNFTVAAVQSDSEGYEARMVRTTDAGKSWTVQNPGILRYADPTWKHLRTIYMIDSLHIIAIGDSGLKVRTSDGGNTWLREDYPTAHVLTGIHFSDPLTGIIVGGAELITTTDGGVTWQNPLSNPPHWWMVSCHSFGGGRFQVLNYDKGMLYTTNDNWKSFDSSLVRVPGDSSVGWQGVTTCHFFGRDSIIASGAKYIRSFTRRSKILLSTDGGNSWTSQLNRFTYAWPEHISTVGNVWLGVGWGQGMVLSTDHGKTWIDDSVAINVPHEPYQFTSMDAIVVSPTKAVGIAGDPTLGFVVALNLTNLRVEENEGQIYGTHVYPNPASGLVSIESSAGPVPIYVVDVLGRQLLRDQLGTDGIMHFNVSNWATGVYQVNMLYYGKMIHITNLVVVKQ